MRPGDIIDDRFELRSRVAAGGMGVVYRALDRSTGEDVALKLMNFADAEMQARFLREARILAELRHPAIVRYIAHGTTAAGEPYLAMEWLAGMDLSDRLAEGALSVPDAVALIAAIAEALALAHDRGAVHRDIKPQNIYLPGGSTRAPKLLDFGVARLLGDTTNLTQAGAAIGTPTYMSPEQVRGGAVDSRSDLFSLGSVLFECITGGPPWSGASALAVMAKIMFDETPKVRKLKPEVSPALERLLDRLLDKDRSLRIPSAKMLAAELRALPQEGISDGVAEPPMPASLTRIENRLVCVVLAEGLGNGPSSGVPDANSATMLAQAPEVSELMDLASAHAARLEVLLDGSTVAVLAGAVSATDLCARAARFALALKKALPRSRISLATGRAVVSESLPTGEAIESAAALFATSIRLGSKGIRVDASTAGLLGPSFQIERGPGSFILLGEDHSLDQGRRLLGKPTPCVGRARELSELSTLFARCVEERRARAVLLTGPAGSGKSRVRHELLSMIAQQGGAEVWIARGDPMRKGSSLGMLAQMIRQAAGIREGELVEVSRRRLCERAASSRSPEDAARVAEFLGEIVGAPFPDDDRMELRAARANAMLMADQMQRAWEDLLLIAAASRPVVLVLEDLQWGDLPTTKFIDAALRNVRDRPLFVFALGRGEIDEVFPGLWSERSLARVELGELSSGASEELARAVLGADVAASTIAKLVEQAAGNAFYLEELIRAVAEGHGDDHVPGSVLAMAQARLEALPEALRAALRAASIFGATFWLGGVASLLGAPKEEVAQHLADLAAREIAIEHPTPRFSGLGEREASFRHSLMRDAAYGMLTDHDRVLGHRLAAEWLTKAGEHDSFVLANHFDRGGDRARAAAAYGRAAEQALEANDLEAVLDRTWRGSRLGAKGEALAHLRLLEATAYHWRAEYIMSERAALDAIRGLSPRSQEWYRAVEAMAESSLPIGKSHHLLALGEALHSPLSGAAMNAFLATAATLAMQLFLAGKHDAAEAVMRRLEVAEGRVRGASPLAAARCHFARATRGMVAGDLAKMLEHAREAVTAFDLAGDQRSAALMRSNLAFAYMEIGAYRQAEDALRSVAPVAERLGVPMVIALTKQNLGLALARRGELEEARSLEGASLALFRANGYQRAEGTCCIYMAMILALAGDLPGALAQARDALAVLQDIPPLRAFAFGALAQALLDSGDIDAALEAASSAMDLLRELGSLDEGEALVRLVYARALRRRADVEAAREVIATAREILLSRAAKISDIAWRESFLRQVPENARTLELAEELAGAPAAGAPR